MVWESLRRFFPFPREIESVPFYSGVALIRRPAPVSEKHYSQLLQQLTQGGFLCVEMPTPSEPDETAIYPTDYVHEVGETIIVSSGDIWGEILEILNKLPSKQRKGLPPIEKIALKWKARVKRIESFSPSGFVCNEHHRLFIMDEKSLTPQEKKDALGFIRQLESRGWTIITADRYQADLGDRIFHDLDFLVSIFAGKDEKPHLIVPTAFVPQMEEKIKSSSLVLPLHPIPNQEALRGGCNIADLRHGWVLVAPHAKDAPTTTKILTQYAHPEITILNAPPNFLEGGGGPRCSIASISLP